MGLGDAAEDLTALLDDDHECVITNPENPLYLTSALPAAFRLTERVRGVCLVRYAALQELFRDDTGFAGWAAEPGELEWWGDD